MLFLIKHQLCGDSSIVQIVHLGKAHQEHCPMHMDPAQGEMGRKLFKNLEFFCYHKKFSSDK